MAALSQPKESIGGGCLCGKVRYTIDFPSECPWPPDAHTCQCTQCRKNSGSLVLHFITVSPSQLRWFSSGSPSPSDTPLGPFKEFSSSAKARRGFCAECGSTLSWRNIDVPEEFEIVTGTIDETFLIGDRTTRVESKDLAEKGNWERVLREEESDSTILGRALCFPQGGNFFFRNAVQGVTDTIAGEKRFVENSKPGLMMLD